ncbi:MAG TPA: MFS transporter [Candidatus Dormibacteraeota bacterium]|nr:MFS transporter [Candidatus Dormibacteraeota bacterium]
MTRGPLTWFLYAAFACMAFLLNGLGAVLAPLQKELGVTRGDVAFYTSVFAAGLIFVGLTGGALVARVGRSHALRLSIGAMVLGGLLFAVPGRAPTLIGDVLIGLGAALMIQLVPALLVSLHPHASTAALGEINSFASGASVIAPLAVAAGIAAGLGWRAGYLGPAVAVLIAVLLPLGRAALPAPPATVAETAITAVPIFGRWIDLVLSVSVEFCMVFWAASAIAEWHGASAAEAPALASLFLVGMAVGRGLALPITRRIPSARNLILACVAVAAAGFAVFWTAPPLALSAAGLALTGLGVALLYPTTVGRLVAAWPHAPDHAAARAALGSGVAIAAAPFVLGQLSDWIGLRLAFLIVPVLLALLVLRAVQSLDELDHGQAKPAWTEGAGHHREDRPQNQHVGPNGS